MYRKENGPHDAATDKADIAQDLEIAEEEVGIKGAIVENVGVWNLEEGYDPVEQAGRQFRDGIPMICIRPVSGVGSAEWLGAGTSRCKRCRRCRRRKRVVPYSGYRRLGYVFGAYTRLERFRSRMKQVRHRPRYMATGAKVAPSLESDAVLLPLDVLRVPPSEPSRADPVRLSLG